MGKEKNKKKRKKEDGLFTKKEIKQIATLIENLNKKAKKKEEKNKNLPNDLENNLPFPNNDIN